MVSQRLIAAAAATAIGATAWRGTVWTIGLTPLIPMLIFHQPCRSAAGTVGILYFAAASWPMMASARAFWSLPPTSPSPLTAWMTASLLLALPWIMLWSSNRNQAISRCPLALLVGALPPFGLIGWASPLAAAGVLFPGTNWLGVVTTATFPGAVLHRQLRRWAVPLAATLSFATNLTQTEPPTPQGWGALNTSVDTASRSHPVFDFEAIQSLQASAVRSTSRFLLAPESAVLRWNEATSGLWQPAIEELRRRGATLLLGTTRAVAGGLEYQNLLLAVGTVPTAFVQRYPVPFAMWKPFGPKDGTVLRLTGRGTIDIGDHRAAVLVCYEQLLVWPILHSALERPTLILGIANDYWCRDTHIPQAQQACLKAWARLFRLPVLTAVNQ